MDAKPGSRINTDFPGFFIFPGTSANNKILVSFMGEHKKSGNPAGSVFPLWTQNNKYFKGGSYADCCFLVTERRNW